VSSTQRIPVDAVHSLLHITVNLKIKFLVICTSCMFYLCFSLAIQLFVSLLVCLDVLDVPLSNPWFSLWSYSIVHSSFFCFVHIHFYLVQKTMYMTCAYYVYSMVMLVFVTFSGLSLNGRSIANNSIVLLQNIGEGDAGALLCITNRTACCIRALGLAGEWFYPDGRMVPIKGPSPPPPGAEPYYRNRGTSLIRLNRRPSQGLSDMYSGVYCCQIPDQNNVMQTWCVGAYLTESGGEFFLTFCF